MVELGTNQPLRALLISNGRRFVERHLSSTRYVHDVESFYRELLPDVAKQPAEESYAEVI
jgi:hypothetical protein